MQAKHVIITVAGIVAVFASVTGAYFVIAAGEITSQIVLETSATIIDQEIEYPSNPALITSKIVTVPPGSETGWHTHDYPLVAYIMDGQVTVDYGDQYGTKTYVKGDSFVEAVNFSHNGINQGNEPAKILVTLLGEK